MSHLVNILKNGAYGDTVLRLCRDRVVLLILAGLLIVFAVDPPQALKSLIFMGDSMVHMAPFFALALGFAGSPRPAAATP